MRDDDQHTKDQFDDHIRRIAEIRASFDSGEISIEQKREFIAAENAAYYRDPNMKSTVNGERLTETPRATLRMPASDRTQGCPPPAAWFEARAAMRRTP